MPRKTSPKRSHSKSPKRSHSPTRKRSPVKKKGGSPKPPKHSNVSINPLFSVYDNVYDNLAYVPRNLPTTSQADLDKKKKDMAARKAAQISLKIRNQ